MDKGHGVSDIFKKYIVNGNKKLVVFLKNTTHLRDMKPVIEKWFTDAGFTVRMYEVHSKNVDKDKEFQAFKEDAEDGIIKACLSVNMIAEGIHGDIDGVIMLRETMSPNMYFQMIGRAFSCGKKTIPLIFDLVANSQFISSDVDNFPNELRGEIKKRKEECKKESKEYEAGFDVDEFIVIDYFMDVVSGFREIEWRLQWRECREWTEDENEIFKKYYPIEGLNVMEKLKNRTRTAIMTKAGKLELKAPVSFWTNEEEYVLKKYYPIEGMHVIKRLEGRTENAIQLRVLQLNLKAPSIWTEEENEILKRYYPKYGTDIIKKLPNRSKSSIMCQARRLNISSYKKGGYKSIFTDEENEIIREYYPIEGNEVYRRLENKSKKQCKNRATTMGIHKN